MREIICAFVRWEAGEQSPDRVPKRRDGAASGGAQHRLQFGEHLLDRIEIGAVWREIEQLRPRLLDGLAHTGDLVGRKVVHDDHIARSQGGRQALLHVGEEGLSVHGAIQHQRGGQFVMTKTGDERRGFPMPVGRSAGDAFSPGAAPEPADHVRGCPGFIQKDQRGGIQLPLLFGPGGAGRCHVRAILLGGAQDFF